MKCNFCKEEYTDYTGEDNGLCDSCFFSNPFMHEQLWVFEETAIEYGWTKETSPIEVINPDDEIWDDSEYKEFVRGEA